MSFRVCFDCGAPNRSLTRLPHGWICIGCRRRRHYHPERCPGCSVVRPLVWRVDGEIVCASCAGVESIFACLDCGREDHPYANRRCARCILSERLTGLLTDPTTVQIHSRLVPLFEEMGGSELPQTGIWWLNKKPGTGPRLLAHMATRDVEVSHDTFRALPPHQAYDYLRTLMAAVGVLPPFDIHLERMPAWIETIVADLKDEDATLIRRFAHWHVLRAMRQASCEGRLTQGVTNGNRRRIRVAINLITFFAEHDATCATATQDLLERYQEHLGGRIDGADAFLRWLHRSRVNTRLKLPYVPTPSPTVTVADEQRWAAVELLLHDQSLRLYTRVAGLFVLLFAQPLSRVMRMRTNQITQTGDAVMVTFHTVAIQMPPGLDDLLRQQLNHRGMSLYVSRDTGWLFPGGRPGRYLSTESIRAQLVARGIKPHQNRKAALFHLASTVPAPVLADLIGITDTNAANWAKLAARDWTNYIADRATTHPR